MSTWLELISNPKIPNTAEFDVNGEKVTLGQVREAYVARERDVEEKRQVMDRQRAELADVFAKMTDEKVVLEASREELRRQKAELDAAMSSNNGDDSTDDRITKKLNAIEESMNKEIKKLNSTLTEVTSAYLDESWDRTIADYGDEVPEGATKADIAKYAMSRGILNKHKIPDLKRALDEITAPKRHERDIRAAEERGAEKERERQVLATLGSPNGLRVDPNPDKPKFKTFDEAIAAAAADPEIVGMLNNTISSEKWLY